ncbi:MAG: type III-B CRISPR module RAMP protein Cmr1 [Anaerolineae bacterium]|nr:type III-B CRISPR module RAMP protein Cmr1 [Anaerolineae bacterium]
MQKLRVKLETVTPLLLRGADNRTPELRPPSFRGAMRYWWRAALGGIIRDNRSMEHLHLLESAVFGDTKCGSAITVRLGESDVGTRRVNVLPHKGKGSASALVGTFELVLSQPRGDDPKVWHAACASLELALTFGGIGLRSRRGYGTLRVAKSSDEAIGIFPTSWQGWRNQVKRASQLAIKAAIELAEANSVSIRQAGRATAFPHANREGSIFVCNARRPSPEEAMVWFMQQMRDHPALGGIRPQRRASPLWMRVIQTDMREYGALCVVLASRFKEADYAFVQQFLAEKLQGEPMEVEGWNV